MSAKRPKKAVTKTGKPRKAAAPKDARAAFERALAAPDDRYYLFHLYVTGLTQRSTSAIENIKRLCEGHLKGHYKLEVVDICQNPNLAKNEQILAAPTLVKLLPLPLRRFIGDLSDQDRLLIGLNLQTKKPEPPPHESESTNGGTG